MKKYKNKILIGLAKISVVSLILSACLVDSDSIIPMIVCAISVLYLLLLTLANS